jgi:hypothetical protein
VYVELESVDDVVHPILRDRCVMTFTLPSGSAERVPGLDAGRYGFVEERDSEGGCLNTDHARRQLATLEAEGDPEDVALPARIETSVLSEAWNDEIDGSNYCAPATNVGFCREGEVWNPSEEKCCWFHPDYFDLTGERLLTAPGSPRPTETGCILGRSWHELDDYGRFAVSARQDLPPDTAWTDLERRQLEMLRSQHPWAEAGTIAALIESTSVDDVVVKNTILPLTGYERPELTAYRLNATSWWGLVFRAGTTEVVAEIRDGDFHDCGDR